VFRRQKKTVYWSIGTFQKNFLPKSPDSVYLIDMQRFPLVCLMIFTFLLNFGAQAQTPQDLFEAWDKNRISNIFPSDVRHKDLKNYLEQLKKLEIKVWEVGRSYGNREIYQMEWGKGAIRVMMWSQMHGDEPTATPALIDMFAFLQKNRDKAWVKKIEETITIRAVPMLNPDGSELYQRRNLQGIDINRDARNLQTPEAQLLKKLRDEWQPQIGFNLLSLCKILFAGIWDAISTATTRTLSAINSAIGEQTRF
jgi:hypothetical protein